MVGRNLPAHGKETVPKSGPDDRVFPSPTDEALDDDDVREAFYRALGAAELVT